MDTKEINAVCGVHLHPNDLERFKFTLIDVENEAEKAFKVAKVVNGTKMCVLKIGLPKSLKSTTT